MFIDDHSERNSGGINHKGHDVVEETVPEHTLSASVVGRKSTIAKKIDEAAALGREILALS